MRSTVMLSILALLAGACSDDSGTTPTSDSGAANDMANSGDGAFPSDQKVAGCDYPKANYGTVEGKVVENFPQWEGYADADYLCKKPEEMVMDTSKLRQITFASFHCKRAGCSGSKKKLLWVMVSAGWCAPCQQEVTETQLEYEKGAIDPRVQLVNVLYEDDRSRPVTADFAKKWASNSKFKLTFPIAMDPEFKMAAYFDRGAVPFNMLVDLDTMKIVFRQTGGNLRAVGNAMFKYLADNP
jgi:thiol-disulfide isomerase/thioredoxin